MLKKIYEVKISLESLTIYRALLQDSVISQLSMLLKDIVEEDTVISEFISHYGDFYNKLFEHNCEGSLKDYLAESIVFDDSAFSRACEKSSYENINPMIANAAERDLECLYKAASISSEDIKRAAMENFGQSAFEKELIRNLPKWASHSISDTDSRDIVKTIKESDGFKDCTKALANFYMLNGSGEFAKYKGFVWERNGKDGCLKGIVSPDPVSFSDLIGYEMEREEIINNTLQFLNGFPANNVLLYGTRGTGKSSSVKALLNEYGHLGLRMIELPKSYLNDLNDILRIIKDRPQKFIIFIDDLVFGDSEEEYTSLKAVLEGGLESKPSNVIIYATSNRRHLIKEMFSDRPGFMPDDEVHDADTMQEKLSLADRFGITVTFSSPDKKRFLEIVDGIARNRKLDIDTETLHREALIWEMQYNGRSGRTARQFIDWLEGSRACNKPDRQSKGGAVKS